MRTSWCTQGKFAFISPIFLRPAFQYLGTRRRTWQPLQLPTPCKLFLSTTSHPEPSESCESHHAVNFSVIFLVQSQSSPCLIPCPWKPGSCPGGKSAWHFSSFPLCFLLWGWRRTQKEEGDDEEVVLALVSYSHTHHFVTASSLKTPPPLVSAVPRGEGSKQSNHTFTTNILTHSEGIFFITSGTLLDATISSFHINCKQNREDKNIH